jgi:hypothetical protein
MWLASRVAFTHGCFDTWRKERLRRCEHGSDREVGTAPCTPDVPIWTIYKGVMPFCAADLIKLILMVLIPAITLWLQSTMIR